MGSSKYQSTVDDLNHDNPLISIITVTYNAQKYLEKTIKSVINQTYDNIEYIIIDGGSTDRTVDIIKKYESSIDYWVSEPDSGIYDAMNKGIKKATGRWLNFMNAGDVFFDRDVINLIFNDKNYDSKILYGDVVIDYGKFEKHLVAGRMENLWKGMQFSHQGCFIDSEYHKKNLYSLKHKIVGDFDFFYKAYFCQNIEFRYVPYTIAKVINGGLSDVNQRLVISHWKDVVLFYTPSFKHKLYYLYKVMDVYFRTVLKRCLPNSLVDYIKKIK